MTIHGALLDGFRELKHDNIIPDSAALVIDAEPYALGLHRVTILIECDEETPSLDQLNARIAAQFKHSLYTVGFDVIDHTTNISSEKSNHINQINILINLLAIVSLIGLSAIFPPSLWLTTGLTGLSFLTTAFTARHHLFDFYTNLRTKNIYTMSTTITLGWLLSLIHTLYHAITMPFMGGLSMLFMNFIMPVVLIMVINGMDELKRWILLASKKMQLSGMNALFPQMASEYPCYSLSQDTQIEWSTKMEPESLTQEQLLHDLSDILDKPLVLERKSALKKGMIMQVKRGECFPVDCMILQGNTQVNASVLTGEHQQGKQPLSFVPAGAINLSQTVTVCAMKDAYNSTVNQLLFVANRAKEARVPTPNNTFLYLYSGLIGLGVVASILAPLAFGTFTFSVLLQNMTGILFAVCPCTMVMAHELPNLLSLYHRSRKGILLRNETLLGATDDIQTIVFDKTGTLTTGHSEVESAHGISRGLWERIYLLEKHHGAEHPLANAIVRHYEARSTSPNIINDMHAVSYDSNHRGLSGVVQGRAIHIGNALFLKESGIALPDIWPASIQDQLARGYSPVYIAQDHTYQGIIWVKHEVNPGVLASLRRLKQEGKHLVLLTGDSDSSARGFNQQNGSIFEPGDVYADQTPEGKEVILKSLMCSNQINPKGLWFVGDGLNDAPCARMVSDHGGVSCAMHAEDKAAFFTDIGLNGTLDYLFQHQTVNRFLDKIVTQNQGLLLYGAMASLAFILTLSMAGIAVFSLIPIVIMVATTLFVLFNAHRVTLSMDMALDPHSSWFKQCLAHDGSIGLLVSSSALLMCGMLISTVITGALGLPFLAFADGLAMAISSVCVLAAGILLMAFMVCGIAYLCSECVDHSDMDVFPLLLEPVDATSSEVPHTAVCPNGIYNRLIVPPVERGRLWLEGIYSETASNNASGSTAESSHQYSPRS